MGNILIKGATIVTMTPEEGAVPWFFKVIPRGDLLIVGDRIAGVGELPEGAIPPGPLKVMDGGGRIVLPGFVNAHCHAAMTLFRGYGDDMALMDWLKKRIWPAEAKLGGEDVYWGTLLACIEMIRAGVTTFADMYFHMDQAARAVRDSGIRASLSIGLVSLPVGKGRLLHQAEEFSREWNGKASGRITTMLGPHAPYTCPPSFLEKVMELAARLGVGIHIHLSETRKEVEDCFKGFGKSPIKLMEDIGLFEFPVLAAHAVHASPEDVEILARRRVGVAHNPGSNMKLASGVAPLPLMLEKGVYVGLGTDGAASNNNLDLLEEARLAALLHKVNTYDPTALPAACALYMATLGGARALRLDAEIGSLEVGKKADVILMETRAPHLRPDYNVISNVIYSASGHDISTVIVNGKLIMEDRRLLTLDEEEALKEVDERAKRLTA